eukprot:2556736-Ditylum_brightwellii.AAC.1
MKLVLLLTLAHVLISVDGETIADRRELDDSIENEISTNIEDTDSSQIQANELVMNSKQEAKKAERAERRKENRENASTSESNGKDEEDDN